MDAFLAVMFVHHMFACGILPQGCQKMVLDPLKLDQWTVVSHYVGAGNQPSVLGKNSKCSYPLFYLSSPDSNF